MNFYIVTILLVCVMCVNISPIGGQYYPHRNNQGYNARPYDNPFQRAYENQGVVYERFTDYGSQKRKPYSRVTQSQNAFNHKNNDNNDKSDEEFGSFEGEDDPEINFGSNLDYNDVSGGKDFDPFKYVSDGVGSFGDNLDFDSYFNNDDNYRK